MIVKCVDDQEIESYGFLWLKKRKVKMKGLTDGKDYKVLGRHVAHYGNVYFPIRFEYFLVVNDEGIKQLYSSERLLPI